MSGTLVITPCGATKLNQPAPAYQLYLGPYFKANLRYAHSIASPSHIFILSGRYGLVPHDAVIAPYEQIMDGPGSITQAELVQQKARHPLLAGWDGPVVGLGGRRYVSRVLALWPQAATPLAGVGGIGRQMRWLKEHTT